MTYVLNSGTPGFTYTQSNQTLTVGADDFYGASNNGGVFSSQTGSSLINSGIVFSGNGNGASFSGSGATILNTTTGSILGLWGIKSTGPGATITNRGEVKGYNNIGVWIEGTNAKLTNTGDIYGELIGLWLNGSGAVVDNTGTIRAGAATAVRVSEASTKVVNKPAGVIDGALNAITSDGAGSLTLDNRGTIDGKIMLGATGMNDKVVNKGTIKGTVELGPGNDTFTFAGGKQGIVYGNDGIDTFAFKTKLAPANKAAKIGDFTPEVDVIGLSKKLFGDIGPKGDTLKGKYFQVGKKANDKDDRIIYDKASGKLFFDPDGNGGKGQKLIAKLDDGLNLKASDFLVIA